MDLTGVQLDTRQPMAHRATAQQCMLLRTQLPGAPSKSIADMTLLSAYGDEDSCVSKQTFDR